MTSDEIFDILRPIVILVTGVPECILANPNAESPLGEYASINPIVSVGNRGQPNVVRTTSALPESVDNSIRRQMTCTAWVNFYRGDTRYRASLLKGCNKRSDISTTLFLAKLGWNGEGPVNNLTALQSDNYESRAQIQINLWFDQTDLITINSIEKASIVVEYEDGTVVATADIKT